MRKRTRLPIIETPDPAASIIQPEMKPPVFVGKEDEDLLCGSCGVTLSRGVSAATIGRSFVTAVQALVKCPKCGKYNRLPAEVGH